MERFSQQRYFLLRPTVQFLLLPLPLAIAWIIAWRMALALQSLFLVTTVATVVVSVGGLLTTRLVVYRRFRKSQTFGKETSFVLSEQGIHMAGPLGEGTVKWPVYPRAVRYDDGIMLLRPRVICWLPDKALQGSTPEEATHLVQANTALRHVA